MSGKESPFAKFLTHYRKGDFVFRQDEEGDEMYIVQSGSVAIKKKIGGTRTTVTVLEKGDFFGEMSILERLPRTADAEVLEPEVLRAQVASELERAGNHYGAPARASATTRR